MAKDERQRVALTGWVCEMGEGELPEVPLEGIDLEALTEGDEAPMFVTIEAVAETTSRNRRRYGAEVVQSIIEQVNGKRPDGYAGHIRDEDRPYVAPESETIWLGGVVREIGGKLHGFIKGYVLPSATSRRDYLRRAKAAGKRVAVSIYGTARGVADAMERVFEIVEFELESIDWARPGAEGIVTSGAWSLASEQTGGRTRGDGRWTTGAMNRAPETRGGFSMTEGITLREMLAQVTAGEVRQVAPVLVEQLVREAQEQAGVAQALQTLEAVGEILGLPDAEGITAAIQEMRDIVRAAREALDVGQDGNVRDALWETVGTIRSIREAMGITDQETDVAEAVSEMAQTQRQAQLEAEIAGAVANEAARPAVRAIAVAEMGSRPVADVATFVADLVAREDVKTLIESMQPAQRMPVVNPGKDNRQGQGFKYLT